MDLTGTLTMNFLAHTRKKNRAKNRNENYSNPFKTARLQLFLVGYTSVIILKLFFMYSDPLTVLGRLPEAEITLSRVLKEGVLFSFSSPNFN